MVTIPFLLHTSKKDREERGACISLGGNDHMDPKAGNYYSFKGFWMAGTSNFSGDFSGVEIAGLVNGCQGDLTGVSVGTVNYARTLTGVSVGAVNYAKTNGRFALQIGVVNCVPGYDKEGTLVQVGLSNQIGSQTIPFLNIRRKKKTLEEKTYSPK